MRKLNRTATTSTPTVAKLTRKADPKPLRKLTKSLPKPKTGRSYLMSTYDGRLPKSAVPHHAEANLALIPIQDAPGDEHFVPVDETRVPPETYFVFDVRTNQIVHMVSQCGHSLIAWDTDREGRYFRSPRKQPLVCPRSVEYSYDSARAFENGEDWSPVHPDYKGTLSSRRASDPKPEPTVRRPLHKPATAPKKPLPGVKSLKHPTGVTVKMDGPKKLKRVVPVDDGGILSESGLDQSKLNSAADAMADKYADAFPMSGGATKPLRKMRKK